LKKILGLLFISISFDAFSAKEIRIGECQAIPSSKKYIQGNFSLPYPKTVSFKCDYHCRSKSSLDKLNGKSIIRVRNIKDDATRVVCQGVKVKKTTWGWDFDKVVGFYAHDTKMASIQKWAKININYSSDLELEMRLRLKKLLIEISSAYLRVEGLEHKYFIEAGTSLQNMANALPGKTDLVDRYLVSYGAGSVQPNQLTKEYLIKNVLNTYAKWRLP
jgi:hypothetical protein